MHILITTDTVGGVWTYTQELVTGLAKRGHRVTLVSFGSLPGSEQANWLRDLPDVDYLPTEYRLEWMEVADRDIKESRRYLELLTREVQPDVLHLSQYCYGDINVDVPRVVVAHSDVLSWWAAVHGTEPDDSPWIRSYRQNVTNGLGSADVVVAPSRWMLSALSHHFLSPRHGVVIYNGRSPELFDSSWQKRQVVLSVGRLWDEGKHVSLLLEADLPLVQIAGWTQEPGREKKEPPACLPNVELLGPRSQEELRRLYAEANIYAGTSRYEPFGLAPLEAALSRCVLVMNDIPVFHELWDDCAIYFRKDDPADLSRVVRELAGDPKRSEQLAEGSFQRAREKFTASRMVDEYEAVYQQISSFAVRLA